MKEKAKTSYEISEDSYKTCAKCKSEWASDCGTENCDATKTRWVRLEDAEKEIDKIEEATKWLQTNYEEYIKNERLELKQKLQQLLKEFPSSVGGIPKVSWRVYVYSTEEIVAWKRKFEELLKEEKAKPT
jgi:uncharacterized protein YdcH (DUF465 family)